jgi:uncharacterized protein YndB with AHSA1/START domain
MSVVDFRVPPVIKATVVKVPPARAFELFAGDLGRWWPLAQFHTGPDPVDCMIEPQVGGRVFERAKDGKESVWGHVLAYEPPHRLSFSWLVGLSLETEQLIDIRFTAERGGTRIELTHSGWEKLGDAAAALRERYDSGWGTLVERCFANYANAVT